MLCGRKSGEPLTAIRYSVCLGAAVLGCASVPREHRVLPAAETSCDLEEVQGAELRARVMDQRGAPLPGIPVLVTSGVGSTRFSSTQFARTDGWAVLALPGNQRYEILIKYPGFVARSGELALAQGCRAELRVVLHIKRPDEIIE